MLMGYQRGMCGMHHSTMSPRNRREASIGKMTSFCACTSLSMSAWIVPRSCGTQSAPKRRFAAATYIARIAGAGAFMVIETEAFGATRSKPAKRRSMSSTVSIATPPSPTFPRTPSWSLSSP